MGVFFIPTHSYLHQSFPLVAAVVFAWLFEFFWRGTHSPSLGALHFAHIFNSLNSALRCCHCKFLETGLLFHPLCIRQSVLPAFIFESLFFLTLTVLLCFLVLLVFAAMVMLSPQPPHSPQFQQLHTNSPHLQRSPAEYPCRQRNLSGCVGEPRAGQPRFPRDHRYVSSVTPVRIIRAGGHSFSLKAQVVICFASSDARRLLPEPPCCLKTTEASKGNAQICSHLVRPHDWIIPKAARNSIQNLHEDRHTTCCCLQNQPAEDDDMNPMPSTQK